MINKLCFGLRHSGICILGCLLLQSGFPAQDKDLLIVEQGSPQAYRFSAVGRVFSGNGAALSMASGFLISSCHVLSAAHVLAKSGEHVRIGAEIRFFPGDPARHPNSVAPIVGRVVAASPEFIMQEVPSGFDQQRTPNDWALIELDRTIDDIPPIKLLYPAALPDPDATYTVVGYPFGQVRQGLFAQEHCSNWSSTHRGISPAGILIADCSVRSGMSGGPILLDNGNQGIAAGIISERFTIGSKVMTIAVPVSAFAENVQSAMRESDICAAGSPFVWPASLQTH